METSLGNNTANQPRRQGPGVPVATVWVFVVAIWGTALANSLTGDSDLDPTLVEKTPRKPRQPTLFEKSARRQHELWVPTLRERVARRHGDYRTETQILKDNALIVAVWDKDESKARRALADGGDPNAPYLDACGHGYTALMEAGALGHEGLIDLLLANGADPNVGFHGETPASIAANAGHARVVRRLLATCR